MSAYISSLTVLFASLRSPGSPASPDNCLSRVHPVTQSFASLSLPAAQLENLTELGYSAMTPVQAEALPVILQGHDVRAQAKTGSGKTAAFGIGLLQKIDASQFTTQAMVLCPTRELADQVTKELRRLARYIPNIKILTLCGGQPMGHQLASLAHAPHIVVGTPGRLQEHLRKQSLLVQGLHVLVLDEADRMLDMGFSEAIDDIIGYLPVKRQTLLFSATYPQGIETISARIQRSPVSITTGDVSVLPDIEQQFYEASHGGKLSLLKTLLGHHQPSSCVVFCNTKRDCQQVCEALTEQGISVAALHGDLEQRDRDQVLIRFANHSCRVLVATDVAARGLDIKDLPMVVNYELSFDPEVHVHRIGRTARAGGKGLAVSLVAPAEITRANALEDYIDLKPQWLSAGDLTVAAGVSLEADKVTLCIDGGRKAKIRPGDILGALTGDAGLTADDVGKIDMSAMHAYVAIRKAAASKMFRQLQQLKIKGKNCKVRLLK
ncbi:MULTISPECIES: ATP-dependent RNA helicase DbpA [unclassified Tatumella]|uniref:ATP-dependent RNA helicase DbpA n=1 Tax=unclassified Tatumella TaxID=2649542 RepID=UPI001BB03D9E|nr:ATP-dependent RNA helicase DbpA [Tatumella sp. JGM91]MBS0854807.1 ATP-dependent RNA helicase DbpA [Tatumella sp. JGM16]MBS0912231.1 ATP-dependent RNA helicase DbpA [Tatumella sp. JGM91]